MITAKEQERLGANRDIQATNRIILNSITGAPRRIMENEMTNDSNPALVDMYLKALLMRESTNNYEAEHKASVIEDYETGNLYEYKH